MLGLVWIGLALAYGAAGVQWGRSVENWHAWEAIGTGVALLWSGLMVLVLHGIERRWGERVFIATAICLSLVLGASWGWVTRNMTIWPMDAGMFRWFLDRVAVGGYSDENLKQVTWMYDYALWTHRALPLLHPLRVWCGPDRFVWVVQIVQAVLGSVTLVVAWRIARLLAGSKAGKWTVLGILSMPGFGMQAVGLNHQVWGMCWFVSGMWLWTEWFHGRMTGWKRSIVCGSLAIVLGPLLKWEGFLWPAYLVCGLLVAMGETMWRRNLRNAVTSVVVMIVIPTIVVLATTSSMEHRIKSVNPQSINGGQLSFIARGWDFQAWGEYAERVERLDILTPPEGKTQLFKQYLAAQAAYNGPSLAWKLFPVKLAKYMLAGYASLAEEILRVNGACRTARVVLGMRVGWFLLLYAPWMLWGLWRLIPCVNHGRAASLLVPVALFGVAVMFVGETSPRYAISVQPLLLAAGGCGWMSAGSDDKSRNHVGKSWQFFGGIGIALVAYLVFCCVLIGGCKEWTKYALADMREAVLEGGHPSEEAYQGAFEAEFPDGVGGATWAGRGGGAAMYLRGRSWREKGRAEISTQEGEWRAVEFPVRLDIRWERDEVRRIAIHRMEPPGPLYIGYVDVWADGHP